MLHQLVTSARQLIDEVRNSWFLGASALAVPPPARPLPLVSLDRVVLSDGVARTLFEQFRSHRAGANGQAETGWVLLGLRQARQAVALATLPAGAHSDAGVAHIRFNATAQAIASRIIRQSDRRLTIVGVVHTHPGSLRHPSEGDLRGDREWVARLRGQEGVFAIGTADAWRPEVFSTRPSVNVQCLGGLRFDWFRLRAGEGGYRPLPVEVVLGPDLARSLHRVWPTLEDHAERLEHLLLQHAGARITVMEDADSPGLSVRLPLPDNGGVLCVMLHGRDIQYHLERDGERLATELPCWLLPAFCP